MDEDELKAAKKEYESIRAAEKEEKATAAAELEHKNSTMEQIRSKAYWDHMNEGLKIISTMKEGIQKANESAYENRGISVQENEKKQKQDAAAKEEQEKKDLQNV